MKALPLKDIIGAVEGELLNQAKDGLMVEHVAKSVKDVQENSLYFDLDANIAYVGEIVPSAVVTEAPQKFLKLAPSIAIIKVKDIAKAYWAFITYYRSSFAIPIVGITGTCGKTTTKEMVKCILKEDFNVQATEGSRNGLGMNLEYLMGIDDKTQAAVFEMGVYYPNDMINSLAYFKPNIRVMLNIGVNHLNGCDTPENYFQAKLKMLNQFDAEKDTLILNADDLNIRRIDLARYKNVIFFGINASATLQAKNIAYYKEGMKFTLAYQGKDYPFYIPLPGKHNIYNLLAAVAICTRLGLTPLKCAERIAAFKNIGQHLQSYTGYKGCIILDDTWNNSPPSMTSALAVLQEAAPGRKKIALLGRMPELGMEQPALLEYEKIGRLIAKSNIDLVIITADEAQQIGKSAIDAGYSPSKIYFTYDADKIYKVLEPNLNDKVTILLKMTHSEMLKETFKSLRYKLLAK